MTKSSKTPYQRRKTNQSAHNTVVSATQRRPTQRVPLRPLPQSSTKPGKAPRQNFQRTSTHTYPRVHKHTQTPKQARGKDTTRAQGGGGRPRHREHAVGRPVAANPTKRQVPALTRARTRGKQTLVEPVRARLSGRSFEGRRSRCVGVVHVNHGLGNGCRRRLRRRHAQGGEHHRGTQHTRASHTRKARASYVAEARARRTAPRVGVANIYSLDR